MDTHVIFPAAAFVEMALEAGVQLFEGRPFAIEDFEIRKPLILPDPASGLVLELTYEPTERTFTIQSRFEQAASWSVHVVGSLRGERTESSFAASAWERPGSRAGAGRRRAVLRSHERSRSALRRGVPPRPRTVRGRRQIRRARSPCPKRSRSRAAEYALHPVLLDGALHVFSAGAKTVEDRTREDEAAGALRPHPLPALAGRLQPRPRPRAAFQRRIHRRPHRALRRSRPPCVLVDGFRAISMSAARRPGASGGGRDLVYHVDWERTASDHGSVDAAARCRWPSCATPPLAALEEVIALRGRAELEAVMAAEDDLAAAQLARGLREMGVDSSPQGLHRRLARRRPADADGLRAADGQAGRHAAC